jgi:hypothetical protein
MDRRLVGMLSTNKILASLDSLSMSGLLTADKEAERVRRKCALGEAVDLGDRIGTARLGAIISRMATVAAPNFLNDSPRIEFAVLSTNFCNACAVADGQDDPAVLIHAGLVKSMIFHLELAEMCHQIHGALGDELTIPSNDGKTGASFSILAYGASCALDHYALSGQPLPRIGASLAPESKERLLMAFIRSIWFVTTHEVGHIRLGHSRLRRNGLATGAPALAVVEEIDAFKDQEFAADRYVADTLERGQRELAVEYLLTPLDMFSALELRLRQRADTHPMALNRLSAMLDHVSAFVDAEKSRLVRATVQRIAGRHEAAMTPSTQRVDAAATRYAIAAVQSFHRELFGGASEIGERTHAALWDDIVDYWFGAPPP